MNHILDTCRVTKFEGGLKLLHEPDNDTESYGWNDELTATTALTK